MRKYLDGTDFVEVRTEMLQAQRRVEQAQAMAAETQKRAQELVAEAQRQLQDQVAQLDRAVKANNRELVWLRKHYNIPEDHNIGIEEKDGKLVVFSEPEPKPRTRQLRRARAKKK